MSTTVPLTRAFLFPPIRSPMIPPNIFAPAGPSTAIAGCGDRCGCVRCLLCL
uniref:Uncharacterized protein n=1 Tax=Arundo donax TaxID=35708 RepID=A0A0A9H708_ARUDO